MELFFDIETVLDETVPEELITLAREKHKEQFNFLPEYNKILCISVGYIDKTKDDKAVTTTIKGNEKDIIKEFYAMVKTNTLVGFNINGFDIPFIVKRGLKHEIPVQSSLKTYGKKPWDMTNVVDLYTVYKMVGYNSSSLDAICHFLGLKSSKDEGIDGSKVQQFHDEGKDENIYLYCERDVVATIDVFKKFKSLNFI